MTNEEMSPILLDTLQSLGREYGAMGVARAAASLTNRDALMAGLEHDMIMHSDSGPCGWSPEAKQPDPVDEIKAQVEDMTQPRQAHRLPGLSFYGAVSLIDYHMDMDGLQKKVFIGHVVIHEANEFLGFRTGASEANWFVSVDNSNAHPSRVSYVFPGCKVAHIVQCTEGTVGPADSVKIV